MFKTFSGKLKYLLPILVLLAMAGVYVGGNWLTETVHNRLGAYQGAEAATQTVPAPVDTKSPAGTHAAGDPKLPTQATGDPKAQPGDPKVQAPPSITTNPVELLKRQLEEAQRKLEESKKEPPSPPLTLQSAVDKFLPLVTNFIIGALFLLFAYLVYARVKATMQRLLSTSKGSDRGKMVVRRAVGLLYWLIAGFIGLSFMAPDLLTKLFLGISIVGAALTLALQGVARDFVCGIFMQFSPKFELNDEVQIVGMDVKGKVVDINYLSTYIQAADGKIAISNGELWSKAVKVLAPPPPPPSKIIIPSRSEW